jgi:mono/diheme cytochrome c family protein
MMRRIGMTMLAGLISSIACAQEGVDTLVERGGELFNQNASCWVCHGRNAEGLIGPALTYGPTPAQIFEQIINNPQMAVIQQEMNLDNEDLLAISMYIRSISDLPVDGDMAADLRHELAAKKAKEETDLIFPKTERDMAVEEIQSFDTVLADWQRRAKRGESMSSIPIPGKRKR